MTIVRPVALLVLLTVLAGTALAFTDIGLSRAGYLPAGTEVEQLRSDNARHYSNGDGSITAVIEADGPGGPDPRPFPDASLNASYTCFIEKVTIFGFTFYLRTVHPDPTYFYIATGYYNDGSSTTEERGMAEWGLNTIPDNATVTAVACSSRCVQTYDPYGNPFPFPTSVPLYEMVNQPSLTPANATVYNDAGSGTLYASYTGFANDLWMYVTLNGAATLLQSRLTAGDWFAVGYSYTGTGMQYEAGFYGYGTNYRPKLRVTYTVPATHDVDVTVIVSPATPVDSGTSVPVQAQVMNRGTSAETFNVLFRINGTSYNQVYTGLTVAPGATVPVNFPNWIANVPRGNYSMRCSTMLATDEIPGNDSADKTISMRVIDADAGTILYPSAVDSGVAVQPQVRVYNRGTSTATFRAILSVDGTSYWADSTVTNLAPDGGTTIVSYGDWVPPGRGNFTLRCSTYLAGDMVRENDTALRTVFSSVRDVQMVSLDVPVSGDSSAPVTPQVTVQNVGTAAASFPVQLLIDGSPYNGSVTNLASGASTPVTLSPNWQPTRGPHSLQGYTQHPTDMNRHNDTVETNITIDVRDVRMVSLDVPVSGDSSAPVTPQVTVENLGTAAASFPVQLLIDGSPFNGSVTNLASGASTPVTLSPNWQPTRGPHSLQGYTQHPTDLNRHNDTLETDIVTAVRDIGVTDVIAPVSDVTLGSSVTPVVDIGNFGTEAAVCDVVFTVRDNGGTPVWTQTDNSVSVPVSGVAGYSAGASWPAGPVGSNYTCDAHTVWVPDQHPENDAATGGPFDVLPSGTLDVGVATIDAPTGYRDTSAVVIPQATVENYGTLAASFDVVFYVTLAGAEVWSNTQPVSDLGAGATLPVTFAEWPRPHAIGSYVTRCTTRLAGDAVPANDSAMGSFSVGARPDWPVGWDEVEPMPLEQSNKAAKDGAWLTWDGLTERVYAAKGNKSFDFYTYDPIQNAWTRLDPVPNGEGKAVSKGGHGCSDGQGTIYTTKGNNTLEFYKYMAVPDSGWVTLEPVPIGAGKKVKGGTNLVFAQDYVYLLKGYGNEFYRFDVVRDSWEQLANAPAFASPKYDKGSFMTYDGTGTIYVHQAKYHKLYAYDLGTQAWMTGELPGMPFTNRITNQTKKSKDGGAAAWSGDGMYAFKGGNTQEFWYYAPGSDSGWVERDTIPAWGMTQRKKKVKAGGSLTSYDMGILFGLKGNKTRECWRYVEYAADGRDGVMANQSTVHNLQSTISIAPNPLSSGFAVLHWNPRILDPSTPAALSLYDAVGRCVLTRTLGPWNPGTLSLDLRALANGVYLARVMSTSHVVACKLVVER